MTRPLEGVHVWAIGRRFSVAAATLVLEQLGAEAFSCDHCGPSWPADGPIRVVPCADADVTATDPVVLLHDGDAPSPHVTDLTRAPSTHRIVLCDVRDFPPGLGLAEGPPGSRAVEAAGGLMSALHRHEGSGPVYPALPLAATAAGILLANAAVLTLRVARPGAPQHAHVTELDGGLLTQVLSATFTEGTAAPPVLADPLAVSTPLIRIYACADGRFLFSAPSTDAWSRAAKALGVPELFDEHPSAPWGQDRAGQERLRASVSAVVAGRAVQDVVSALMAAGVSAAPVDDVAGFAAHEHVQALDALRLVEDGVRPGAALLARERDSADAVVAGAHDPTADDPWRNPSHGRPLSGIRVVELCTFVAGPLGCAFLADHGADVIKVESPPRGDPAREQRGPFLQVNRGKSSVLLDLADPADLAAMHDLVRTCDVFVTNMRSGGLRRFGLDVDGATAIKPNLVYAWISGWGSGGSLSAAPGVDPIFQAMSGIAVALGGFSGQLRVLETGFLDSYTGMFGAAGVIAALHRRDRTGRAQYVESSLLRSAIFAQLARFATDAREHSLGVDPVGSGALDRLYRDREGGFTYVAAPDAAAWHGLLRGLGRTDLAERYPEPAAEPWDGPLAQDLAAAFATVPAEDVPAVAANMRPTGGMWRVHTIGDLAEADRGDGPLFVPVTAADGQTSLQLRPYVAIEGFPRTVRFGAPALGSRTQPTRKEPSP